MITANILTVDFARAGIAECVEYALQLMEREGCACVTAPDSEMMQQMQGNKRLRSAVRSSELILPAGSGILLASRILGTPIRDRISALDFAAALLARMSEKEMSVFLLGDDYRMIELARDHLAERYPGLKLSSGDTEYYSNEIELAEVLRDAGADLILLGMESPRQELWMHRNRQELSRGLIFGLGEGMKVYAGLTQRAPKRWRDSDFEWLYWIFREPKRLVRTLKRSWIVFAALWRRIFG